MNPDRFEELAKSYLDDVYPASNWVLLPRSGDGNRDVQAISVQQIFGEGIESTQWVEAKYTKEGKRTLTKGQLDPTVVSALLDDSVRALMFLTNSLYTDSYIQRAQQVLQRKLQGGVRFIDREHLEAWLDEKPTVVSSYFSSVDPIRQPKDGSRPQLISAQLIGLADYLEGHWEQRKVLYQSEELILALVVSSNAELMMSAQVEATGVSLEPAPLFPSSFQIRIGRQIIPLRVVARQSHPDGKAVVSLLDKQGDRHCAATLHYSIGPEALHLDCSGQVKASQGLHEVLRQHQDTPRPSCISLIGASGSGKSFLLKRGQRSWFSPMHLQVFNEPSQNARELCRSLLFLSFGVGADLEGLAEGGRFKSKDLPTGLIKSLQDGMDNVASAQETLETLLTGDQIIELFTHQSRGDAKVLVFDDVHKADELSRRVLIELLRLLAKSNNQTLVVLAKHPEYTVLDDVIRPLLIKDIHIGPVTENDVEETLRLYLQPEAVRILLPETCKVIKTVLELRYLASELRANLGLMTLSAEEAVAKVRAGIVAASIPEIAARIQIAEVEEAANLVAVLDGGIPEAFLVDKFDASVVAELLDSRLFNRQRDRTGIPVKIVSSHDLLRAAYLERKKIYSPKLAGWIEALLKEEPQRRNDVLGHLCLCGQDWRQHYLSEALKARDALLAQTRFGAARCLSHTLYNLIGMESASKLGLAPEEHISIVYGYADCVNHTEGSGRASVYFDEAFSIGKGYPTSLAVVPFVCQAKAEQFNMRFWQHDLDGFQTQAEGFLKELDSLPSELDTEQSMNAKMTTLNRLMMVEYLLDSTQEAENAFRRGWVYAEHHGDSHDRANLLMDRAKSVMLANPVEALRKMEQAGEIYAQTNTQERRRAVCQAQMAYLRSILHDQSPFAVEAHAAKLWEEGFTQEYANCLLQISALHLAAGRYDEATSRLDELGRQSNALDRAPRRRMLYYHLRGVVTAQVVGPGAARKLFKQHKDLAANLGKSYGEVAQHNLSLAEPVETVSWAFERRQETYWLEPRLW